MNPYQDQPKANLKEGGNPLCQCLPLFSLKTKGNTFAFNVYDFSSFNFNLYQYFTFTFNVYHFSNLNFNVYQYSTFTFDVYHYSPLSLTSSANFHLMLKVKEKIDFLRFVKHSFNSNKTGGQILLSRTRSALSFSHFYIKNYQKATICT